MESMHGAEQRAGGRGGGGSRPLCRTARLWLPVTTFCAMQEVRRKAGRWDGIRYAYAVDVHTYLRRRTPNDCWGYWVSTCVPVCRQPPVSGEGGGQATSSHFTSPSVESGRIFQISPNPRSDQEGGGGRYPAGPGSLLCSKWVFVPSCHILS